MRNGWSLEKNSGIVQMKRMYPSQSVGTETQFKYQKNFQKVPLDDIFINR